MAICGEARLVFTFTVQLITGLFLWMAYSPSTQTAWESVYFIQYEMQGGWLLRGVHHFTAQAMVILLVLHLMQVVINGAYSAPRSQLLARPGADVDCARAFAHRLLVAVGPKRVLGNARGYQLDGARAGGDELQQLVVGGPDYGHHTLTRFFVLHAGVLPGLLILFLVLHIALFRRHGLCARQPIRRPDCTFWPDQVLKDAVACLAVLVVVLVLVLKPAAVPKDFGSIWPRQGPS